MPNHPVAEDRPSAPPASHRRPHARGDVDLAFEVDEDAARELARARSPRSASGACAPRSPTAPAST